MDLLKRIRKNLPNLSNLSKISHENETVEGGSTEPRTHPESAPDFIFLLYSV